MSKNRNRYGSYQRSRLPREKKVIRIPGSLEDDGKFYRCWNCGFICNGNRDVLVGNFGGVNASTYVDVDGLTKYKAEVTGGCPFCGSGNYR